MNFKRWSIIIPTYRRPYTLQACLKHLSRALKDRKNFELIILDNGSPDISDTIIKEFEADLMIKYIINPPGKGLGYSLTKGAQLATGSYILEINDDALIPRDFFSKVETHFDSDESIGIVGVRAIEKNYQECKGNIGTINQKNMAIIGNFHKETGQLIDVEHVYGFCFAYSKDVYQGGAKHDAVLLSKPYSTGNRIETDQCLSARRLGYRVTYDGSIGVKHLAKPRPDIDELSTEWRVNNLRNTLYLFLKHYGLFGKKCIATRYALIHDLGLRSMVLRPNASNSRYFLTGLCARFSGASHWITYLIQNSFLTRPTKEVS